MNGLESHKKESSALEPYLKKIRPHLFAFIYRLCGDVSDAEDFVQNVLLEAFLEASKAGKNFQPTPLWAYQLAYPQLKNAMGRKAPWQLSEEKLVAPLLTPPSFWESIQDEQKPGNPCLHQRESFHIGFLSQLQKLTFEERALYVWIHVLGFQLDEVSKIMGVRLSESASSLKRADEFMQENYFNRDSFKILWRAGEEDLPSLEETFVDTLNQMDKERFRSALDPEFRCLMLPAPILDQTLFFDEFLPKAPKCQILDFEINGQKVISFEDTQEVQALAVVIPSTKGIATVLGFEFAGLDPKLRTETYKSLAKESVLH